MAAVARTGPGAGAAACGARGRRGCGALGCASDHRDAPRPRGTRAAACGRIHRRRSAPVRPPDRGREGPRHDRRSAARDAGATGRDRDRVRFRPARQGGARDRALLRRSPRAREDDAGPLGPAAGPHGALSDPRGEHRGPAGPTARSSASDRGGGVPPQPVRPRHRCRWLDRGGTGAPGRGLRPGLPGAAGPRRERALLRPQRVGLPVPVAGHARGGRRHARRGRGGAGLR